MRLTNSCELRGHPNFLVSSLCSDLPTGLVSLVRGVCKDRGWLAGWRCFSQAAPAVLHKQLIDDVVTCAEVYSRICVSPNLAEPVDVGITVKANPNVDSLMEVGPKGLGGKAWKVDPEYEGVREKWSIPGFAPIGPGK